MLKPKLIRAARALLEWEQTDLAKAAQVSLGTIRRLEQGGGSLREATARRIAKAFERAGLVLLQDDEDGGLGVRFRESEARMDAMRSEYSELMNKIKGWLVYTHGLTDTDEDLEAGIIDLAANFDDAKPLPYSAWRAERRLDGWPTNLKIPEIVKKDLVKLATLEADIGVEQDEDMLETARERGWDGDPETLSTYFGPEFGDPPDED